MPDDDAPQVVRHLHRFAETADGTIGKLIAWCTLEEENQGNRQSISAIPVGEYVCKRAWYNKGGYECFEVTNVPGRSNILIHKGNTEEDTEGCILLGKTFGALMREDEDTGQRVPKLAVLDSAQAFHEFMASMQGVSEFKLVVTGP